MPITLIKNKACVLGTLESIALDAGLNTIQRQKLFQELLKHTNENITYVDQIQSIIGKYFRIRIMQGINFSTLRYALDSANTYAIIDFHGKSDGSNQHYARLTYVSDMSITIMDPSIGALYEMSLEQLEVNSPVGMSILLLEPFKNND